MPEPTGERETLTGEEVNEFIRECVNGELAKIMSPYFVAVHRAIEAVVPGPLARDIREEIAAELAKLEDKRLAKLAEDFEGVEA